MKKKNKYNVSKVDTEYGRFDSKKEYNRYLELLELQKQGTISNLQRQVKYQLLPKNDKYRELSYIADFVYTDSNNQVHIEDVKGLVLPEFKIKQKLFYHIYHQEIEIYK